MGDFISLKKLGYEELAGVVNLYPWYGAARREMCLRMAGMGGDFWGNVQFSDAALYVGDRSKISDIIRGDRKGDYEDKDIDKILKSYLDENQATAMPENHQEVHIPGGDFFSRSQYEKVRKEGDNVFSRFAVKAIKDAADHGEESPLGEDFCTETLAGIYEEQGYYEQARHIYSRLLLKFPEKNAYFAALIDNLDNRKIKI